MRLLFFKFVMGFIVLLEVGSISDARAADTRIPVWLNEIEHEFVLAEMRGFVESLQLVLSGLAKDDMKTVAEAAKKSGKATANNAPSTLGKKFPSAFAMLGGATHQLWDKLAAEAEDMGNKNELLKQLGILLNNCVTCHASYRLAREKP